MRISTSAGFALSMLLLVACVAGCGGGMSASDALQRNLAANARQGSGVRSNGTSSYLLYVSNARNDTITAYSWQSGALLAVLNGFNLPHGLCVDHAGDVYVTDFGSGHIFEYQHGNLILIKTLSDPHGGPNACSVDAATGNLAVADGSGVWVYAHASGAPTLYTNANFRSYLYLGYDANGNLFVDGTGISGSVFAELPKSGTTLGGISLNQAVISPSGLQWDGRYLAICDNGTNPNVIYAFAIAGSTGTLKSTTTLDGSESIAQFWIPNPGKVRGTTIVAANYNGGNVRYWKYPAGGAATMTITSHISKPFGVTVSE